MHPKVTQGISPISAVHTTKGHVGADALVRPAERSSATR